MTTIDTPSGRVAGRTVDTARGPVTAWLGLPYAAPPVGPLRLRPPRPAPPWTGVRDATEAGPRPIQPPSFTAPPGEPESEDCLVLNVWSPDVAGAAPVMVWIHGGSFTGGSGSIPFYDGARLAARGVVLVTVNYRLGALGFLDLASLGGESWAGCTNVGLQDQSLALAWVAEHIGAFGGDPTRVTLFGESAGAMSASAHLALVSSRGRFRRVIAQSGAAGHVQSAEAGSSVAARTLDRLGIGVDELDRLADLPLDAFRDVTASISADDPDRDVPLPFRPTVDGNVLAVAPLDALRAGAAADVDLLTGTNRDEMNLFRLIALLSGGGGDLDDARLVRRVERALAARGRTADPASVVARYRAHRPGATNADVWAAVGTDTTFRMPMIAMLDAHTAGGGRAWSYHWQHESTAFDGVVGAAHAIEIPFVFENLDRPGAELPLGEMTEERHRFAAAVADRWVAFASTDDPAAEQRWTVPGTDESWPGYEAGDRRQAVLDIESDVAVDHEGDLRELWLA